MMARDTDSPIVTYLLTPLELSRDDCKSGIIRHSVSYCVIIVCVCRLNNRHNSIAEPLVTYLLAPFELSHADCITGTSRMP